MKLLFENWREYLNEAETPSTMVNRHPFDPKQDGAWFQLRSALWKDLNKVGFPEGLKLGFRPRSLRGHGQAGDNPFEVRGVKTSWDVDSKYPPGGEYGSPG